VVNRIARYDGPPDDGDGDDFEQDGYSGDGWECPAEREVDKLGDEFSNHLKEWERFRAETNKTVGDLVKVTDRIVGFLILAVGLLVAFLLMRK
jgi:hypothetical protein